MARPKEFDRDEVLGRTIIELGLAPSPAYAAMTWELGQRGLVRDFECERRTSCGEVRTLAISMNRVTLEGNRYALMTIRDITEQRRAEDAARDFYRRRDERLG